MFKKQNIFLIGPMAAGKTTIGRFLAKELQREFFDSDHVIEKRTGVDIPWIFDVEGEEGFRDREQTIIDELTQMNNIVMATGGGAILRPQNRKNLSARGIVIYLASTLDVLMQRTEKDKKRPLLQVDQGKEERFNELLAIRKPLYEEIADFTFASDESSAMSVAQNILKQLHEVLGA